MKTLRAVTLRNIKLFFKDKGMFFTSLITPVILLVLYATFLGDVYRDSFTMSLPEGLVISEKLLDGLVGGQLVSSILSVSCVTVAFCSNFLMVQDKALGTAKDFLVSPVKPSLLALSYYIATIASTLIICFSAAVLCLCYVAVVGFYMSALDVLLLFIDIILLVLFGTALSSVVNFFLSTQGQISAVGTMVSSCYGFISGAYMPISSFAEGLQRVISFLPGTYGTALLRGHAMRGALAEMEAEGLTAELTKVTCDALDINLYFFGNAVETPAMYAILCGATVLLLIVYVLLNRFKKVR
jgi:multidrug/hemolysin transport system permease protein